MKIRDELLRHFSDPEFHDRSSGLILPGEDRLQHRLGLWDGGWESIAQEIATRVGMTWFPDANVAILNDTESVWTALRLAGIEGSRTLISGVIARELAQWIADPRRNEERAETLRESVKSNGWARLGGSSKVGQAIHDYARLIGLRRLLCFPYSDDGMTIVGTDPKDKSSTMNEVKNAFGNRAVGLARKARKDVEAGKPVTFNDEIHCMNAIAYALESGRETAILTSDADCLEIFRKAQWFLNTHYRAWAVAKHVDRGDYGDPQKVLPKSETQGFFDGPLALYRRQTDLLGEALPYPYHSVTTHLVYVGQDGRVVWMSTDFEQEMLEMFEVRMTSGCCADLFGGRNIHIDVSPIKAVPEGRFIGIGKDAHLSLQVKDEEGAVIEMAQIPALDAEHAMQCCERIKDLVSVRL